MTPDMQNKLSTQIKQALIKRGLPMKILAGHIGISAGQFSKILSGAASMTDDKWEKACAYLGWGFDPDSGCAIITPHAAQTRQPHNDSATAEDGDDTHSEPATTSDTIAAATADHDKEDATMDQTATVTLPTEEAKQCLRYVEHAIRYSLSTHDEGCTFENMQAAFALHGRLLKGVEGK